MGQRYFLTAESTYEDLRQSLNTQLAYPNALGKSVFQTALYAPRDGFRRVLLAVDTDLQNYTTIDAAIAPLLASDAMEEIDEAGYLAAVASATAGVSDWNDITGKPASFAPSAHKTSHATGGSDAMTPADIGAASALHTHSALTDITGLAAIATSGSASDLGAGTVAIARLPVVLEQQAAIGNSGTSTTLSLANGSVQTVTLSENCTFTMPTASAGASLTLILTQSGTFTASFTGVLWSGGTAPTITATNGKVDVLVFVSNGTSWFGTAAQNF